MANLEDKRQDSLCGRMLGGGEFVLGAPIGTGGFSTVYRCKQRSVDRDVVAKVLHSRCAPDEHALAGFEREYRLAARIVHPCAAHIYAAGIEPDGLPWIAMEYVAGVTLERRLNTCRRMPFDEFVPFFERVAKVVQAAHDLGIVHRDLKPSNIMIVELGSELWPKLLDFGIAKLLDEAGVSTREKDPGDTAAAAAMLTLSVTPAMRKHAVIGRRTARRSRGAAFASGVIGTPEYMAPEQCCGVAADHRADLYSLAVIAYEALVGRLPFDAATFEDMARAHCFAAIPPVGPGAPAELDHVFRRALAKLPEERFGSAMEFAGALRTVMDSRMASRVGDAARQWHKSGRAQELLWRGRPLEELEQWLRAPSALGRGRLEVEFSEACRAAAAAAAAARRRRAAWLRRGAIAVGACAAAATIGALHHRAVHRAELLDAVRLETEVEQGRSALLHDELAEAQSHLLEAHRLGDRSPATEFMLARALQPLRAEQARFAAGAGRMWAALWSPDGSQVATADDRGATIWDARTSQLLHRLPATGPVRNLVYTSDGRRMVAPSSDGSVRIWDTASGALVRELRAPRKDGKVSLYFAAAVAGDLVAAIEERGELVQVWAASSGDLVAELAIDGAGWPSVAFSANGRRLAATGGELAVVFDTSTWARAPIGVARVRAIGWDPSGSLLVTGSDDGDVSIWPATGGPRARHLRDVGEPVDAVAWSPDGRLVAAAARDGATHVWDVDGKMVSHGNALHDKVQAVDFDPSSRRLAQAGSSGESAVIDVATGMTVTAIDGPTQVVRTVRFSADGRRLVGASFDGTARVWNAGSPYRQWDAAALAADCDVVTALVPDGRYSAVPCRQHPTRVWDTTRNELLAELPPVTAPPGDFSPPFPAVSADGTRAAIARGHTVEVYELPGGRLLRTVDHGSAVSAVAFAERTVITGAVDGSVRVTDDAGNAIALPSADAGIDAVVGLPNGRVVVADAQPELRVLDRSRREVLAEMAAPTRIRMLRPSADGRRLVTLPPITVAARPILWDIDRSVRVTELTGYVGQIFASRWVGTDRVLTAGGDGSARMWDGNTGELLRTYRGSSRFLADAAIDSSGAFVVGGGADGVLRFWDASDGRPLWTTPAYRSPIVGLHFDGERVVTRGVGGEVTRWDLPDARSAIDACGSCVMVAR